MTDDLLDIIKERTRDKKVFIDHFLPFNLIQYRLDVPKHILWCHRFEVIINMQRHEISNNVVCETCKGPDQPVQAV